MDNKLAYRLPSISLLSLDFPLPTYQAQSVPVSVPVSASPSQLYFLPQNLHLGAVMPGTNMLAVATLTYAYSDPTSAHVRKVFDDGSMSSGSSRGSPSRTFVPKIMVPALPQSPDNLTEYPVKPIIPSIASFTSVPRISGLLPAMQPCGGYYVASSQWARPSSDYFDTVNSPKVQSPPAALDNATVKSYESLPAAVSPTAYVDMKLLLAAGAPATATTAPVAAAAAATATTLAAVATTLKTAEPLKRKKKQCPECHLFFSNLATHKSTHLNPTARPHVCKICSRGFSRSNDLLRHFKCHWKKIGADGSQYRCPFKSGPRGAHCCHLLGIFSRCDTYKNHLKAIHFQYPGGTRKSERNLVPGWCRLCEKDFKNVDEWFTTHVDTGKCPYIHDK